MSVHNAEPGEIYEDAKGDRWLVISILPEPSVTMQRIQPQYFDNSPKPDQQGGGISGAMWNGFAKIADAPKRRESTLKEKG